MKKRHEFPKAPKETEALRALEARLENLAGIRALEASLPRSPGVDAVKELESRLALLGKSDSVSYLEDRLTLLREVSGDDFKAQLERMRETEPERAKAVETKIDLLRVQEEAIRKLIEAIQKEKAKERERLIRGETTRRKSRPASATSRRRNASKLVLPRPPDAALHNLETRLARLREEGPEKSLEQRLLALHSPDSDDRTTAAYARLHQVDPADALEFSVAHRETQFVVESVQQSLKQMQKSKAGHEARGRAAPSTRKPQQLSPEEQIRRNKERAAAYSEALREENKEKSKAKREENRRKLKAKVGKGRVTPMGTSTVAGSTLVVDDKTSSRASAKHKVAAQDVGIPAAASQAWTEAAPKTAGAGESTDHSRKLMSSKRASGRGMSSKAMAELMSLHAEAAPFVSRVLRRRPVTAHASRRTSASTRYSGEVPSAIRFMVEGTVHAVDKAAAEDASPDMALAARGVSDRGTPSTRLCDSARGRSVMDTGGDELTVTLREKLALAKRDASRKNPGLKASSSKVSKVSLTPEEFMLSRRIHPDSVAQKGRW